MIPEPLAGLFDPGPLYDVLAAGSESEDAITDLAGWLREREIQMPPGAFTALLRAEAAAERWATARKATIPLIPLLAELQKLKELG